jgi:hypothetical protein
MSDKVTKGFIQGKDMMLPQDQAKNQANKDLLYDF